MMRSLRSLLVLLLVMATGVAYGQPGEISGVVRDDKNLEVIGAVVQVLQAGVTKGGGLTDLDGRYSVKALEPGSYDVTVEYIGYKKMTVTGVRVVPGTFTTQNFKLEPSTSTTLEEVVVVARPPIIDPGKPGTNQNISGEQISRMATRNTSDIAATATNVYQRSSGSALSLGGARADGTLYIVDGVQVRGASFTNQTPGFIENMQVLTSGIPARYGDASGGIVNITTRGMSKRIRGGAGFEHSVDGYNHNLAYFTLSGPLLHRRLDSANRVPVLGFSLAGDYLYDQDNDPSYDGNYVLKPEVLQQLQQNPLVAMPNQNGVPILKYASEFIDPSDVITQKRRVNADVMRTSLSGKLDYQLRDNTHIILGGSFRYQDAKNYNRLYTLFSPGAIGTGLSYTGRGFVRFTQRFAGRRGTDEASRNANGVTNAFYSVQADYQTDYVDNRHPSHKHDPFKYGYVGKFVENFEPVYFTGVDTATGRTGIRLLGYQPTGVDFYRSELNPMLANYTSDYYRLSPTRPLSLNQIAAGQGLRNGDQPGLTYSLWGNVGTGQTGYSYSQADQFSMAVDASLDYKHNRATHTIEFGLYYQQQNTRGYGVNGSGLWTLMRQLTNNVVNQAMDFSQPIFVVNGRRYSLDEYNQGLVIPGPNDTILYNRLYNQSAQSPYGFDYNLRARLGKGNHDYINVDELDPSTFSLDMFTADELLNSGRPLVNYYGYDYTGEKVTGQVNFNDFWTKRDQFGRYTRPIGSYRPNYIAGYLSDRIRYKQIILNLGVRVERFDNNTKVLRDPYSLYALQTLGDVRSSSSNILPNGAPANIGNDYVVYVNDNSASRPTVIGYRDGDNWYDPSGRQIQDPAVLKNYTGGKDPQPFLQRGPNGEQAPRITDTTFDPNSSFVDYKPQVNAMPRISFTFPITEKAQFYAHYDVIVQRPRVGAFATASDYYYLAQNAQSIIPNPDLKPEKTIDYEIGFQQELNSWSGISLNGFYKERRDQIQVRPYLYAWPNTYYTYGNRDFSTTKGLAVKYEMRPRLFEDGRVSPLSMNLSYTLQFAEGTGSSAASANGGNGNSVSASGLLQNLISAGLPNLRFATPLDIDSRHIIAAVVDFRYGNDMGPVVGNGLHIFENAGANLTFRTRSGEPYTRYAQAMNLLIGANNSNVIEGGVASSRLPWHYILDLRVDKGFNLNFIKTTDEYGKKNPLFVNAFVYIQNVLNTREILGVYGYTGSATDDGFLTSANGQTTINTQNNAAAFTSLYMMRMNNPNLFNAPRRINLGLQFNF